MSTDKSTELEAQSVSPGSSVAEVFLVSSFGGPVAHLGYFRDEFVARRKWLDERAYADPVALCQFLPGTASSQVGMAVGLSRAGYPGALAAWAAFTLPSAIALVLFAFGVAALGDVAGSAWLHGLKIAAVAGVAQAVLGMMRSLAPDKERATLAGDCGDHRARGADGVGTGGNNCARGARRRHPSTQQRRADRSCGHASSCRARRGRHSPHPVLRAADRVAQ